MSQSATSNVRSLDTTRSCVAAIPDVGRKVMICLAFFVSSLNEYPVDLKGK